MIALLWQAVFARDAGVSLAFASRAALFLAVWLIYLMDRLLDTGKAPAPVPVTARHRFCLAHRRLCYSLSLLAVLVAACSIPHLPPPVLEGGLVIASLVGGYLLIVHWSGVRWLSKEAAVGALFAMGTALAPLARSSTMTRLALPALVFGALCWTNVAAIEKWEGGEVNAPSAWMVRHIHSLSMLVCLVCLPLGWWLGAPRSAVSLGLCAIGFRMVSDLRGKLTGDALRVAIDLPLLAPLLWLGLGYAGV